MNEIDLAATVRRLHARAQILLRPWITRIERAIQSPRGQAAIENARQLGDDAACQARYTAARAALWAFPIGQSLIHLKQSRGPVVVTAAHRLTNRLRTTAAQTPDGVRVVLAGALVVAVILGIGVGFGGLGRDKTSTNVAEPSPTPDRQQMVPAAVPAIPEGAPRVVPLSRLNPITGPDNPPLPMDINGPQGSRLTTGTYEVALTFDDGPDPHWTPQVLDTLRMHRVKATFCVIGVNVVEFPDLVRAIDAEGHTLCNHSWAHDVGLGTRGYSAIVSDMSRTNAAIRAAAPNARISYFRHPGGAWTQAAVKAASQLGMTSLHWDVDPRDWLRPGARAIAGTVTSSAVPGSIVLLHDGGGDRRGTAEALRSILPNLASRFALVALPPGIAAPRRHGIHLPVHLGQQ